MSLQRVLRAGMSKLLTEPLGSSRSERAPGADATLSVLLLENAFKFLPKQEIVTSKKLIRAWWGCHCSDISLLFFPYL